MECQFKEGPVLHIVVVGFHHKKGCQVEFSYPPIIPGTAHDSNTLPEEWKYLPFLALPDGAHNYQEDTVYFHLPPLDEHMKCVYGVSCYRQIDAKALKVREADVTRETVQKSVCVLSRMPQFGLIQAKLQLITHAYFEEKDFSQISILKELYDHMNNSLSSTALEGSQIFLGLSARDLILHFKHKVLILFKLILLEKKILFYVTPVKKLVETLMTILSLFPGMIEHGLADSSHYQTRKSVSEDFSPPEIISADEESLSISVTDITDTLKEFECKYDISNQTEQSETINTTQDALQLQPPKRSSPESSESEWETLEPQMLDEPESSAKKANSDHSEKFDADSGLPITVQPQSATGQGTLMQGLVSGLQEDQYGLPLAIFTKGYLCLPYMALQQHHLLSDVSVRGFVAGATNILFRQQRHLSDAVVDVDEARIQIHDPELRKILYLSTADLRFADYLVKHVTENKEDVFLDGTGWEGGDEWIRAQFGLYVHSLLSSTLQQDHERLLLDYGAAFTSAWRVTHNYRLWKSNKHPAMTDITPGHPFQGQYSVADVKIRLSHSMQNSERGKKIGNAVMTTSRSVVQTGKAVGQSVGGALTVAKSTMSSWFSMLAPPTTAVNAPPQSTE
ncbi:late secretory pathway protein AVL9 homolog isoform X1 [Myxocyprinus asiaticus]|uniref:late secretory pathway protein AVL9 homolog isoform X1 n=1 Tax=Myxocyprinus asiaticus TaxID=70543 RepID=UPI0022227CFC|nr:late secretory pathway protein AVL9 homolog isoform X1 [Myxocyprinus asiaticus]